MTIKPALTPEEWEQQEFNDHYGFGECRASTTHSGGPDVVLAIDYRVFPEGQFSGSNAHALAALCLHQQPFGFDWSDVDALLRTAIDVSRESRRVSDREAPVLYELSEQIGDIADRISSLLPPRKS